MTSTRGPAWLGVAAVSLVACAQGTGKGVTATAAEVSAERGPGEAVTIDWQGQPAVTKGRMEARIPGEEPFEGHYMQVLGALSPDRGIDPNFGAYWSDDFADRGDFGPDFYSDRFWFYYPGRVIAVLDNADGTAMRCRFNLEQVDEGLAGGAFGQCQTTDGKLFESVTMNRSD